MEWVWALAFAVPVIALVNVAFLFVGDHGSEKKHKVPLVRDPNYNEQAKDDGVEREEMPVDVLFVGGGPAGLAGAYHLMQLVKKHNEKVEKEGKGKKLSEEIQICVLEKCSEIGAMGISGMVLDPRSLKELMPDFADRGAPLKTKVEKESMNILLSDQIAAPAPFMPPPLQDHGLYVGSLAKFARWLAGICEEEGIMIFPGFAGAYPIYEDDTVIGVRTGDKGIGHNGEKKANFEPGIDLKAKVTVLTEGTRGSLTRDVVRHFELDKNCNPQQYALGVKEIIEVPDGQVKPGEVMLTAGWPVPFDTFGGAFLYTLEDNLVSVGIVVGLDGPDPNIDPQVELQRMKTHPVYQKYLRGGKVVQYGAKTIPEGGWWSMPKSYANGVMLAGDSGGFLNGMRLKGVHLAIKTGMLAAETAFEALLEENYSEEVLSRYEKKFNASWAKEELWAARNFHHNFHDGFFMGTAKNGIAMMTGGGLNKSKPHVPPDYSTYRPLSEVGGARDTKKGIPYDGKLFLNKLEDVYLAGSKGEEDQPSHLQVLDKSVCSDRCAEEFGNPCTKACPANVYEMVDDEESPGKKRLHLNPTNCVHCKTCDLIDPYINIRWVVPEGGDGPNYSMM